MVQIKWDGWSLEPCITTLTYPCYKRCHGSSCADGEKKILIIIMSGSLGLWAVIGKTVTSWTWMCSDGLSIISTIMFARCYVSLCHMLRYFTSRHTMLWCASWQSWLTRHVSSLTNVPTCHDQVLYDASLCTCYRRTRFFFFFWGGRGMTFMTKYEVENWFLNSFCHESTVEFDTLFLI